VKGETMTPLERLFAVADIANGMGSRLDMREWLFLNTDLVVHIHRVPEGEWIGVQAETHYGGDGVGISRGTLFDERGSVAVIQQAQLVRHR
jgi:acyl-CoA thioesterase